MERTAEKPTLPLSPEMEQLKVTFPEALEFLRKSSPEPVSKTTNLREDIVLLQYAGGTAGLPEGAIITHPFKPKRGTLDIPNISMDVKIVDVV